MSEEKALRYNEGKVPYSFLLDLPNATAELCRIFQNGAKKYDLDNWKKGFSTRELLNSALRHQMDFAKGDILDKEGDTHTLVHAAWNLLVAVELNYFNTYGTAWKDEDDPGKNPHKLC
ncbi:hypothetical protein KC963_01195 [Candidatus Saccharibacteria bacterium]|nr:hypothetical protein [Candidatus Saccharibacteria bacterium]